MRVAPVAFSPTPAAERPRVSADAMCLGLFSLAGPWLAVAGGGRLGMPSTLDAGTLLAILACCGPAMQVRSLASRDRVVLVLAALTWLALDGRVIGMGLTLAGLAGFLRGTRLPMRLVAVWLAVAVHVLWAPFLFRFVGRWAIAAELQLIAPLARLLLPGVEIDGARLQAAGGWYIYVLEGCSAFAGLSACGLVWFAPHRLRGSRLVRRDWGWLMLACGGVVAVNVARILLMVPSAEAYAFWHTGTGSVLVVCAGVALGAAPALLKARPS